MIGAEGGSVVLETTKGDEDDAKMPVAFTREGTKSRYEIAFRWNAFGGLMKPLVNQQFAMSILVNDSDGSKVTQTEWGGGIAGIKDPRKFIPVVLAQ